MVLGAWLVPGRSRGVALVAAGAVASCVCWCALVGRADAQTRARGEAGADDDSVAATNADRVAVVLWTSDPGRAAAQLAGWAQRFGGRVLAHEGVRATAELPRARYGEAMQGLAALGDVEHRSVDARDVEFARRTTTARLATARASLERVTQLAERAKDVREQLAVERNREQVVVLVASLEEELERLEQQAAGVRVHIELKRPEPSQGAQSRLPFPWLDSLGLDRLRSIDFDVQPRDDRVLRVAATGGVLLSGALVEDPDRLGGTTSTLALTGTIRYMGEANPVGLVGGYDFSIGGGGGLLYGLRFVGGLGAPFGKRFHVLLTTGLSSDGITGDRVPFGLAVPLELHAGFDWGASLYTAAWVRPSWVVSSDGRQNGSASAPFGDELSSACFVVWGDADRGQLVYASTGLGAGFVYTEMLGTRVYELRVGWGAMRADYSYAR